MCAALISSGTSVLSRLSFDRSDGPRRGLDGVVGTTLGLPPLARVGAPAQDDSMSEGPSPTLGLANGGLASSQLLRSMRQSALGRVHRPGPWMRQQTGVGRALQIDERTRSRKVPLAGPSATRSRLTLEPFQNGRSVPHRSPITSDAVMGTRLSWASVVVVCLSRIRLQSNSSAPWCPRPRLRPTCLDVRFIRHQVNPGRGRPRARRTLGTAQCCTNSESPNLDRASSGLRKEWLATTVQGTILEAFPQGES